MSAPNTTRNAIGAGFLVLDLILQDTETVPARTNVVAGGSCGNVLAVLAYLGWNAYPVAQLGDNVAANMLCQDLVRWGVKTDFIAKSAEGVTPLIIHRIYPGRRQHRFEFRNPQTQEWLPRFRPFTKKYGQAVSADFPQASVFYFDRATPANLLLAEQSRAAGALIVFEPSASKDKSLFERALALAHFVKFSQQRLPDYPANYPQNQALLEIQTQGASGLVYRMQTTGPEWTHVPAFSLLGVIDTAGAGDWCTAGIIDQLLMQSSEGIPDWFSPTAVAHAIQVGQTYGTINCCFAGARGAMYHLSDSSFRQAAAQLLKDFDAESLVGRDGWSSQFNNTPVLENLSEHIEFYELLH
jgi:sugar/nucleoside kinase (ribokinase family)